jgi:hypothetical protein
MSEYGRGIFMSKYLRISSVGPVPLLLDKGICADTAVNMMIEHWKRELSQVLPDKPGLIVIPEASDRPAGYSIERRIEYYRERGNRIRDFFCETAHTNNCSIAYSAIRQAEDGTFRNSTQLIDKSGNIAGIYDKNHPTIDEIEVAHIKSGEDAELIDCDFGRAACAICFDLNFDMLLQKYVLKKPDIILFSSVYHGGMMQAYWAYSCRSYFVGSIAGLPNTLINPVGSVIKSSTNYFDYFTQDINLDYKVVHLGYNFEKLKKLKDKYGDKVIIHDPGYLGAVLLTCETDEFNIEQMLSEFEIENVDDYFRRSLSIERNPLNIGRKSL